MNFTQDQYNRIISNFVFGRPLRDRLDNLPERKEIDWKLRVSTLESRKAAAK